MKISDNLRATAQQEFEINFGEIIGELSKDNTLYEPLLNEFMKGVEFGVANNSFTDSDFHREVLKRYAHVNTNSLLEEQVINCTKLVFLYGASWGHSIVNQVSL